MVMDEPEPPDLRPPTERVALEQRLDQYRSIVVRLAVGLDWAQASSQPLPASDLSVAGIIRHLAWAEDRWFQGRLLGVAMPEPWNVDGADDQDASMRVSENDSVEGLVALYLQACDRSRAAAAGFESLDAAAAVPSFDTGPVNLRWILVHMIDETARHAGHLDLLTDALAWQGR